MRAWRFVPEPETRIVARMRGKGVVEVEVEVGEEFWLR